MSETRKLAAILVADVVGFSRLAGAEQERTLARLRVLRGDLIDPAVAAHYGRIVKSTGDGALIEFRSVVDAVRCAIEVQTGMVERNAGVPQEKRIELRIGVHLGDVVEENDGDLMGAGVNIAARLEGIAKPGAICLSEDAYRQVKGRIEMKVSDLGVVKLKNIADPMHAYLVKVRAAEAAVGPQLSARRRSRDPGRRWRRSLVRFRRQGSQRPRNRPRMRRLLPSSRLRRRLPPWSRRRQPIFLSNRLSLSCPTRTIRRCRRCVPKRHVS